MWNLFKVFDDNAKYYGHFISLGYNCENAFRFFKKYKFVEASLFTWCNSVNIENFNLILNNFDKIGTEGFTFNGAMWKDNLNNIYFHGLETKNFKYNQTPEETEKLESELISRIAHLKEKFKNQGNDGKKNLYTYTYRRNGETLERVKINILNLKNNIKNFCLNEFDLLVILEKEEELNQLSFDDNVYIRFVDKFAPENNVPTKKYDKKSWNKIFKEFKPNFKLKKKKKYKFEEY